NMNYKSLDKLTVSTIFLDPQRQLLTVSNFKDLPKAFSYLESIKVNPELSEALGKANARSFIISVSNYSTFLKYKNIEEYQEFYSKNYLK
ncbi:MAG: hypothetical protein Q8K02_16220, partial [Flavobacterium sp.]|nr:hypothetical protein [Flavobacterium sp.]